MSLVIFTDEAGFSKNYVTDSHYSHSFAEEKSHATSVTYYQQQFESFNFWVVIIGQHFIESFELPRKLNGGRFLAFAKNNFLQPLEDGWRNVGLV